MCWTMHRDMKQMITQRGKPRKQKDRSIDTKTVHKTEDAGFAVSRS